MAALVLVSQRPAPAQPVPQWSFVGPESTDVSALAIDPTDVTTLYAATAVGLFKTTDRGQTWFTSSLPLPIVTVLAMHPTTPTTLYASGPGEGVFKTTTGGDSWDAFSAGLPVGIDVTDVLVDPTRPQLVYAATDSSGVFVANEALAGWQAMNRALVDKAIQALTIDSSGTLYGGAHTFGVFKYSAGAWSPAGLSGFSIMTLATDPTSTSTLYTGLEARSACSGVFKSTDGALTWTPANTGLPVVVGGVCVRDLALDHTTPSTLYAATSCGVFKSTDGAASWTALNDGLPTLNVLTVMIDPSDAAKLYAGTVARGVYVVEQPPTPTPTHTPPPTETPTITPSPTVTLSPNMTATLSPTPSDTATPTETPTETPVLVRCAGDCDGNHEVTVDELLVLVNISLGAANLSECPMGDPGRDGDVSIDEILTAVNAALDGCP